MAWWIIIVILLIIILALVLKIKMMHKAIDQIFQEMSTKISQDTNTLLRVSSGDLYVRKLASRLNVELRNLRKEQQLLYGGNIELKNTVANIAHDLRTPLTAIGGYLYLLESEDKSPVVSQYVNIIAERIQVMKSLSDELFQYFITTATMEEIELESVNISKALEETIIAHHGLLMEKAITLEIELCEKPLVRHLNQKFLSRIFENLLMNVLKYSEGDLKIALDESGEIVFSNKASRLDSLQVERLFERFYTVESANPSTGLGLSISKHLTEKMGGEIKGKYEDGKLYVIIKFPYDTSQV
jgi:signal transduction histidine kinase